MCMSSSRDAGKKREPIIALGGYAGEEEYMRNIALECLRWFKICEP